MYKISERLEAMGIMKIFVFKKLIADREALERISDSRKLTTPEFYCALDGTLKTAKAEKICRETNRIVTELERRTGVNETTV